MTLRKSFAGAFAFFALTSVGHAADMQPVLKAPPTAVDQQATGYVEVYTGWASTRNTFSPCLVEDGCFSGDTRLNGWVWAGPVAAITG